MDTRANAVAAFGPFERTRVVRHSAEQSARRAFCSTGTGQCEVGGIGRERLEAKTDRHPGRNAPVLHATCTGKSAVVRSGDSE